MVLCVLKYVALDSDERSHSRVFMGPQILKDFSKVENSQRNAGVQHADFSTNIGGFLLHSFIPCVPKLFESLESFQYHQKSSVSFGAGHSFCFLENFSFAFCYRVTLLALAASLLTSSMGWMRPVLLSNTPFLKMIWTRLLSFLHPPPPNNRSPEPLPVWLNHLT